MKNAAYMALALIVIGSGIAQAGPVQWSLSAGGNGHYYEAILVPGGISWTDADAIAGSLAGDWHLATISSPQENAFVYDLADDPSYWRFVGSHGLGPWIGGYKEGGAWKWVTGEPFSYTNWGPREPFGNGDKIGLFGYYALMGPYWNDAYDSHMPAGYIIESASGYETIPVPGALLLGSIGAGLVGFIRRHRAL